MKIEKKNITITKMVKCMYAYVCKNKAKRKHKTIKDSKTKRNRTKISSKYKEQ